MHWSKNCSMCTRQLRAHWQTHSNGDNMSRYAPECRQKPVVLHAWQRRLGTQRAMHHHTKGGSGLLSSVFDWREALCRHCSSNFAKPKEILSGALRSIMQLKRNKLRSSCSRSRNSRSSCKLSLAQQNQSVQRGSSCCSRLQHRSRGCTGCAGCSAAQQSSSMYPPTCSNLQD